MYIYWANILGFFSISGVWLIAGITGLINAFIKIASYYFGLKFALEATSDIAQKVFKSRKLGLELDSDPVPPDIVKLKSEAVNVAPEVFVKTSSLNFNKIELV